MLPAARGAERRSGARAHVRALAAAAAAAAAVAALVPLPAAEAQGPYPPERWSYPPGPAPGATYTETYTEPSYTEPYTDPYSTDGDEHEHGHEYGEYEHAHGYGGGDSCNSGGVVWHSEDSSGGEAPLELRSGGEGAELIVRGNLTVAGVDVGQALSAMRGRLAALEGSCRSYSPPPPGEREAPPQ